jgi:hypothetical protein
MLKHISVSSDMEVNCFFHITAGVSIYLSVFNLSGQHTSSGIARSREREDIIYLFLNWGGINKYSVLRNMKRNYLMKKGEILM